MHIKNCNILLLIITPVIFIISCSNRSEDTLLNDMSIIDYNYAKTLLLLKDLDRNTSIAAIDDFSKYFALFRKYYYNINPEDFYWKSDINIISDLLIRVNYFVSEDEDISAGYLIFHDVKYALSDIRRRNNIDWAMDYLSFIYKTAYRLNELSQDYSIKGIVEYEEKNRIVSVYDSLNDKSRDLLEKMRENKFDIYDFSQAQKDELYKEILKMDIIVIDIGRYLTENNFEMVVSSTENILNIYFEIMEIYASHALEFN